MNAKPTSRVVCGALILALALLPHPAIADDARSMLDNLYVRSVGALHLSTALASSDEVVLSDIKGPAALAIENGPIAGSGASVSSVTLPALSVGYVVARWGTRYSLAIETVLAPPPVVIELRGTGTLADMSLAETALGLPTGVPALGGELGRSEAVPPMVTAVFRPLADLRVQPYVGAGLSYLIITKTEITNPILTEVGRPRVEVNQGFDQLGVVAQVGVEAKIAEVNGMDVLVNLDLKYIAHLTVTATVKDAYVRTPRLPLYEMVPVGDATASVHVNPLVFQAGAGVNF
jgi:outer membrane protein W